MRQDTEKRIIEAACKVFYEKGYNGTTMRDIAQTAGVNLALLHYYFRTKDKIFEIVFSDAFTSLFKKISQALTSDADIFEKIKLMITGYVQTAQKHPQLPGFVMHEMAVNSQLMLPIIMKYKEQNHVINLFDNFYVEIEEAGKKGIIKKINPESLCTDILSLSFFPFMAKNYLTELIYKDKKTFNLMVKQRIEHITNSVISNIIV